MKGVELKFTKQEKRFDKLEAGQKDLQRQISDLKFDTLTQKEFDTLKSKVDKYHPIACWYLIGFSGTLRIILRLPPTPDCVNEFLDDICYNTFKSSQKQSVMACA